MAIIFKYKNPLNASYAPGFVGAGADGRQGDKGATGNALYFVDYELDNSYNIEVALQRIEKDYTLSSGTIESLKNYREYKVNDLILTPAGKCYRLILSTLDSTFKNYKYDIEYLGSIKKKSSPAVLKVVFRDVTGKTINNVTYNPIQLSPFPTDRSTNDGTDLMNELGEHSPKDKTYYNNDTSEIYRMRGRWYEIYVVGTNSSVDKFYTTDRNIAGNDQELKDLIESLIENIDTAAVSPCRYSLQFHLKNTKKYCLNSAPDDSSTRNGYPLNFYKVLEFNGLNMHVDTAVFSTMTPEQQIEDYKIKRYLDNAADPYSLKTYVYISDFMLDRYHPSGNNLECTLNNDKSMWYKTGLYAEDGIFSENNFKLGSNIKKTIVTVTSEDSEEVPTEEQDESNTTEKYICDETVGFYEQGNFFKETTKPRTTSQGVSITENRPTVKGFPKYAMAISRANSADRAGKSLILNDDVIMKYVITENAGNTTNNILLRENKNNPLRSGDSAYFSSIIDDTTCLEEIDKFISNHENIAMVTSKNLVTDEALITEVPIEIIKD